ncbi:MAG: sugar-binding protein [Propionibacteriaceae bacterium]|jgi:putative multiple sugar transport system substrate-binding protein|nr:sugar-binding protein [Propionibacteriaceae bacterium]
MKLRKFAALALGATLVMGLSACSSTTTEDESTDLGTEAPVEVTGLIGISLPTQSLERWNKDATSLTASLTELGFTTTVQYADNKADTQISQIQEMITKEAKVLVIAAVDGNALAPVLQTAADADITVIAYDRLMSGSNVDYYAAFDTYKVGQLQGEFIVEALKLETAAGPFSIEPFAGPSDDANAEAFFAGAWDILLPYIKSGKLVAQSGMAPASTKDWASIAIQGWSADRTRSTMESRLTSYTDGAKVDVVLSPNDSMATGITEALEAVGYTPGTNWPIITGYGGDIASVKNILADKQSMTLWKDTSALSAQVATMIDQILREQTVDVNDKSNQIPSYLLAPEVIVKNTVESILVEKGYYTKDQLGLAD